jgi:hypothetical protein
MAQGLVSLRALYYRSEPSIEEDPEEVGDEDMNEDVPDFLAWLYDQDGLIQGLTIAEREDQLRYQTDDDGNLVLNEDDAKIPRGCLPVRRYAADPDGPVAERIAEAHKIPLERVDNIVRFWKTSEAITAIVNAEHDAGLIIKKTGKKSAPTKAKSKEKVQKMPPKKKLLVTRNSKKKKTGSPSGPQKKGPATSKKTTSTKKKAGKKAPAKAKGGDDEGSASGGESIDFSEVLAKLGEVLKRQDALEAKLAEAVETLDDQIQTCNTLVHDATMQKLNEVAGALGMALGEISEEAPAHIWEAIPVEGDELKPDAQNLMSGPDGERSSILLYLEDIDEDDEGEEEGDDE